MKDPLAIGLGALACGAGLGGGTIVAALVIVRTLEHHVSASNYQESAADPVLAGTLAGLAVGATFGWRRSRWLDNVWQRGVIGALSTVGALLLGFIAWPIDHLFGVGGLAVWGAASFVLGGAASAWAVRGSRDDALRDAE
ncbi:MAG: hypothetical protein AUH78_10465 [Gemmatimonadetes bacterium 13_1_40CM_4_69_8]|nr:MAG: hypothetical protein AUH45_02000 [Gemmatimonadetes bacterium 13_1_40CM_69_22]OLC74672.1 MAG: hypothetical protein AUH78_10465 [Gemmatimonadetes bacterium 13_1_40CM_4_69_8]